MTSPRTQSIAVAVAQASAVIDDVDRNLATIARLVARARREGAEVVVTPELFATGYAPDRAWRHDGDAIRAALADVARTHGIALVASTVDTAADEHRIAASVFDADGTELTRAFKHHLFGPVEQQWMTPGNAYDGPFTWRGTAWGVGICYDVEFPEFARTLSLAGADVLLVPTAVPAAEEGVDTLGDAWHYSATQTSTLQVPARALENGVVIAYANHCGDNFTGNSCIATPFGRNTVLLGNDEGIGVATVALAALDRAREINTYLVDLERDRVTRT